MEQSIKLKTDELNPTLVEGLKKYFKAIKAKEITISFSTPSKKFLRHESQAEANARIEKIIAKKYFKAIKAKEITISFSTPSKKFLRHESQAEANARIEKIIADAESGKTKWVSFTGEEFEELSKALSKINE